MIGLKVTEADIARINKAFRELGMVLDAFGRSPLAELDAKVGPTIRLIRQAHHVRRGPGRVRHRAWRIRQQARRRRKR